MRKSCTAPLPSSLHDISLLLNDAFAAVKPELRPSIRRVARERDFEKRRRKGVGTANPPSIIRSARYCFGDQERSVSKVLPGPKQIMLVAASLQCDEAVQNNVREWSRGSKHMLRIVLLSCIK